MQLITFVSAAAAIVSTVSADKASRNAVTQNKQCDQSKPLARVINRCPYPVYLWSVFKGDGCPESGMVTLNQGETYSENYLYASQGGDVGVSIKISRTKQCKGNDITQLEYFLDDRPTTEEKYRFNYLDVSYVDCTHDCPTKQEGYYLKAGNQQGAFAASAKNTWCPILSCSDAASCAKMSYILPDDVQTKTCDLKQNMDFYMCGSEAPSDDDYKPIAPKPASTLSKVIASPPSSAAAYKVNAAAVTNAPELKEPIKTPKVKTAVNVVYVTKYEYVNAKRHAHGHAHARRHQDFHA